MSSLVLSATVVLAWAYLIGSTLAAYRFAARPGRRSRLPLTGCSPVSVLKPLHGREPGLLANLRSFADQDYPGFQIVLGVRERGDGALPAARALRAERPEGDIELVVDPHVAGTNLKVANLLNMMPRARHDIIVVADSDMRVTQDYLATVAAPLADPGIGIVTCLYKGAPCAGLWSRLAAMHINFGFLPGAIVGEALDVGGGCFGATIAVRRDVLERIGGFGRVRNELADDHRMGSAVRALGLKVAVSPFIVENRVCERSLASLWRQELRWARTSRAMAPAGYAGSLLAHTSALTVLVALFCGAGPTGWGFVLISLLLRWISAAAIARRLGLPREGLWLLPLRDALSFAVFVASFCGRSVSWRDHLFRVDPCGRMSVEGDKPV